MLMGAIANMAPEPVPRHHRRRAVRRCLEHHARQDSAADAARAARVGQPAPSSEDDSSTIRYYSPYDNVDAQGLSAYLRLRRPHRSALTYWEPAKWIAKAGAEHQLQSEGPTSTWKPATAALAECLREIAIDYFSPSRLASAAAEARHTNPTLPAQADDLRRQRR